MTNQTFIPREPIDLVMLQELEDVEQELRRQEQEEPELLFILVS